MSEYDQRQYRLMLDRLNAFEKGLIQVGGLVSDLEGLLNALEGAETSWKQTFLSYWGKLEDARAVALFRGLSHLDQEATKRVDDAAAHFKLLVLEQIDDPADHAKDIDWTKS